MTKTVIKNNISRHARLITKSKRPLARHFKVHLVLGQNSTSNRLASRTFYMFTHKCTVTLQLYCGTEASECVTEVDATKSNTARTQTLAPTSPNKTIGLLVDG